MPKTTWSNFSRPIKAILIAIPFIAVSILGLFYFLNSPNSGKGSIPETETRAEENGNPPDSASGTEKDISAFSYLPEKPIDGKLKGVVEVGATGFNSFVVNIDAQKRWEIVSQDFGQSLIYEGLSTPDDINNGLEKYVTSMADQGVEKKNMHFVISSGAQKEPKTKTIASELKKRGFAVKMVSASQEGLWALKCILPVTFYEKAFVTDIGSGNTKLAWMEGNQVEVLEGPGSKYYEKDIQHDAAYNLIKTLALKVPNNNRKICFIMGGSPFDLVKQHRKGEERYTILNSPDSYKINKPKTKAGLNIYTAIKDATGCETFVFDWNANFSIGYLLDLEY